MADFKSLFDAFRDTADTTDQYTKAEIDAVRIVGAVAYIPFLFWLPLVTNSGNSFGKYHANQGLLVTIATIVFMIVSKVLGILRLIGGLLSWLAGLIFAAVTLLYVVIGLVNSMEGKAKELPIVGGINIIK